MPFSASPWGGPEQCSLLLPGVAPSASGRQNRPHDSTGSTVECILIGQNRAKSILMFNIFLVHEQKSLTCTKTGVWVRKREEPLPLRSVQPAAQQRWQPCGLTDAGGLDVVERGCVKGRGKSLTASGGWGFPPDRGAPNRDLQAGGRVLISRAGRWQGIDQQATQNRLAFSL